MLLVVNVDKQGLENSSCRLPTRTLSIGHRHPRGSRGRQCRSLDGGGLQDILRRLWVLTTVAADRILSNSSAVSQAATQTNYPFLFPSFHPCHNAIPTSIHHPPSSVRPSIRGQMSGGGVQRKITAWQRLLHY